MKKGDDKMFSQYPECENGCENSLYMIDVKIENLLNKELTCRECEEKIKLDSIAKMKWALEDYTNNQGYNTGRLEELENKVDNLLELVAVLYNTK